MKKSMLMYCIKKGEHDINYFKDIPQSEESIKVWLSRWQTFLLDTYKHDTSDYIREAVRKIVFNLGIKKERELLLEYKIPDFISIRNKDTLFRGDDSMTKVIVDKETSNKEKQILLSDIFLNKWMNMLPSDEIKNELLIIMLRQIFSNSSYHAINILIYV